MSAHNRPSQSPASTRTHHIAIVPLRSDALDRIHAKKTAGKGTRLSKKEARELGEAIKSLEQTRSANGLNFSRIQIDSILRQYQAGIPVEFETLGPYLADYIGNGGVMTLSNLIPEDRIGLRLAAVLRSVFPDARLVSLYDDYNSGKGEAAAGIAPVAFTDEAKQHFRSSLISLFKECGAITKTDVSDANYQLISEASVVADLERMTQDLEDMGYIERDGQAITFVNEDAENPLHARVRMRTKNGRWLCEALDAATYWKRENLRKVHIVVLPSYMRDQQDKMWEILRVLGIQHARYHNIFYDPAADPEEVAQAIAQAFAISVA